MGQISDRDSLPGLSLGQKTPVQKGESSPGSSPTSYFTLGLRRERSGPGMGG